MTTFNFPQDGISEILEAALGNGRASIESMLAKVAHVLQAEGCVIWQEVPQSDLNANPPRGSLFVLASWFPAENDTFAMHELPLESASGKVVLTSKATIELDVRNSGGQTQALQYFDKYGIEAMCSAPLRFLDRSQGTLNIYRKRSQLPFSDHEMQQLAHCANHVPTIYAAIRDRDSLSLIRKVDAILHRAKPFDGNAENRSETEAETQYKSILTSICEAVADCFHGLEVTLILQDRHQPDVFDVQASSWRDAVADDRYHANDGDGLTGWILNHRRSVNIFDLRDFGSKTKTIAIQQKYPGIWWRNYNVFPAKLEKKFPSPSFLPPISFMGVPIFSSGSLLGVLRCCAARHAPYYYSDEDVRMLALIAPMIGRFWDNWINLKIWADLTQSLNELNEQTRIELNKAEPNEKAILRTVATLSKRLIPGTKANGIRLKDRDANELYYAQFDDGFPASNPNLDTMKLYQRRFALDGQSSAGAVVVSYGDVRRVTYPQQATSPGEFEASGMKISLHAPVKVGTEAFGTLDIRSWLTELPRNADIIIRLLGSQLGLYLYLLQLVKRIRQAEAESKNLQVETTRRYEDLAHQLRGPVNQLLQRLRSELDVRDPQIDHTTAFVFRGLARKAWQVTMSMGMLAEIHEGRKVKINPVRLTHDWLSKSLIETCMDHRALSDPRRKLRFRIDNSSLHVLGYHTILTDEKLLTQAIGNLVDNAFKYSFADTCIQIAGGLNGPDWFYLSFINYGLQISAKDAENCKRRGWRSEHARQTTGEGSGIGLFLVNHIMLAHHGDLIVNATRADDATDVRILLPINKDQKS